MKLGLIMLAAGNSRRFGSNKLLYRIEGKPMYLRTLEQLIKVKKHFISCNITVVTQYGEIGRKAEELGAQVCYNPHPERGISSSLKIGLAANQNAEACLFAVTDQPWLTAETILALLERYRASDCQIACVSHNGKLGNPCIFSRKYYPELLKLEGDIGGKRVILSHREDTVTMEVEDEKQLLDMDVR